MGTGEREGLWDTYSTKKDVSECSPEKYTGLGGKTANAGSDTCGPNGSMVTIWITGRFPRFTD